MKYVATVVFFGAILISLNSCKKGNTANNINSVKGSWELVSASGSIPVITYPAGNGNIFEFTDSTYKKYINGSLAKRGYYKIVQDGSVIAEVGLVIPAGQYTNRIIFDNDTASNKMFIEIANNKLIFISGYFP